MKKIFKGMFALLIALSLFALNQSSVYGNEVERQALLSSTAILSNNDAEEEVQQVVPIIGDITRNTEGNMMYIVGAGAILFFVGVVIGNHRLRKSKQIKINND